MSMPLTFDEQHVLDPAVSNAARSVIMLRIVDPGDTVEALVARGQLVVVEAHEQGPDVSVFGVTSQDRRALATL